MSVEGTVAGIAARARAWRSSRAGTRLGPVAGRAGDRGRRDRRRAGRERARRHARSGRYPEQRHAQFHQHGSRGGRRDRAVRSDRTIVVAATGRQDTIWRRDRACSRRCHLARTGAAVHADRAGARLRLGRASPRSARIRASCGRRSRRLSTHRLADGGGAERRLNALNQIYDLEIDVINKPRRPLPEGRLSVGQAWVFTWIMYAAAWLLAWLVAPGRPPRMLLDRGDRRRSITFLYSAPPFRTKRLGIWANITIAIPRGVLLKVAGWSSVKTIFGAEPWYIGAIFGLFLLGASTTKDFADMEGDARGGCRTLPIVYGVRRAAWMISPSLRRAVPDDLRRRVERHPDRQLLAAAGARRRA